MNKVLQGFIIGALFFALPLSSQTASGDSLATPSTFDDYLTLKNILKECGISDARLSEVSRMENGRVIFLDLSNKDVTQDGLQILPYLIGNLTELRTLIARDNVIKSIPDVVFTLKQLRTLILASNRIVSVPPEIGNLVNLDSLDLRHNAIESLPGEIGGLKNLAYLQLWGNKLTAIPGALVQLPRLKDLHLKDNRIASLPEGIITMKSLKFIDFQGNKLCALSPRMEAWLKARDQQYRALQKCW